MIIIPHTQWQWQTTFINIIFKIFIIFIIIIY